MKGERIPFIVPNAKAAKGTAGLSCHVAGCPVTITASAESTGGMRNGALFSTSNKND